MTIPPPPSHLEPDEIRTWERVIGELQRLGFYHPSAQLMVEVHANTLGSVRRCRDRARQARRKGKKSLARRLYREAKEWEALALDQASSLGLTPASRLEIQRAIRGREGLWDLILPPAAPRKRVFRKRKRP